jgi:hypothetical protein
VSTIASILLLVPSFFAPGPLVDGWQSGEPPTLDERVVVERALYDCPRATPGAADPWMLLDMVRLEAAAGVPDQVRGVILAAACMESGYRADAIGDSGKAVGLLQLWPWAAQRWGVDRDDPHAAAAFWLWRLVKSSDTARRRCHARSTWERWRAAGAYAVRSPKDDRCRETTSHFRLLRRWRS